MALLIVRTVYVAVCAGMLMACLQARGAVVATEDSYLAYDGDFHQDIMRPQVLAWQKLAKVVYPNVSDDIECDWAANQADSIGKVILAAQDMSSEEQMVKLYDMQRRLTYGIGYSTAVFSMGSAQDMARAFLGWDSVYNHEVDSVRNVAHTNANALCGYREVVLLERFVYIAMALSLSNNDYAEERVSLLMEKINQDAQMNKMLSEEIDDEKQLYRYSETLRDMLSFMMMVEMIHGSSTEPVSEQDVDEITTIANYFDGNANNIFQFCKGDIDTLPAMDDKEYSAQLKQSAEYKARLVEILAESVARRK